MEENREYSEEDYLDRNDNRPKEEYRGKIQGNFNPVDIRVTRRSMTLDLLIRRLKYGELDLYPDFQREPGIWDDGAQSRLIESLIIRLPIPAFYFDATDDAKWLVIDGVQRLTALARFTLDETILNEDHLRFKPLKLEDLEFRENVDLHGKTFEDLGRELQRRIEETQVTVYTIDPGTPDNVKYNIFKRINTGGLPLSNQEIRNASNAGAATKILAKLARLPEFLKATQGRFKERRGDDQECILRVIAFTLPPKADYEKHEKSDFNLFLEKYDELGFDLFLMDTMARMNKISFDDISFNELEEFLKEKLKKAMKAAHEIFGENAFCRAYGGIYSGQIVDSLFEVWGVHLRQLSDDEISKLIEKKEYLVNEFRKLLNDGRFIAAILWESEKVKMVQFRFDQVRKLITETLLVQDPWKNIEENYPIGETVKGTVVRIYRTGTFVELEKGLEGLIQSSEVSWTNQYPNPHNFFREGDLINVVVLEINWMERFILLSYKQSKPDPWKIAAEKYSVGSMVQGRIVRFFSFGAFAKLEDDIDGLIPISELDTRWVENPEDVVSIGDELKLKVINLDINTRKIALSLKEVRGKQPRRKKKTSITTVSLTASNP